MFGMITALALDSTVPRGQVYLDLPPEVVLTSTLEAFTEGYSIGQVLHIRRVSDDPLEVEISSLRFNVNDPGCDDREPDCLPNLGATMRIGPSLHGSITLVGDHRWVDQMPMAELAVHLQQPGARARQEGGSWFVGDLRFDEMSLRQASNAWYFVASFSRSINESGVCILHQLAAIHQSGTHDPAIRDMLDAISVIADRERQYRPMGEIRRTHEVLAYVVAQTLSRDEAEWPRSPAELVTMPPSDGLVARYDGLDDYLTDNFDRLIGAARYMRRQGGAERFGPQGALEVICTDLVHLGQ